MDIDTQSQLYYLIGLITEYIKGKWNTDHYVEIVAGECHLCNAHHLSSTFDKILQWYNRQ